MRKMKKILSVLALTLAVTMMMSTAVFAEEITPSEDYIVTYSAEEITDIDELIELALEQKADQPAMFSMEEEESPQLNVTQVLEIREYEDGSVEKDAVSSSLLLIDETSGQQINLHAVSELTERKDMTKYNVTAFHQMYYTYSTDTDRPTGKLNKICTQINSNPYGRAVTIMHCYNINEEWGKDEDSGYDTIPNAQTNKTYYMYVNSNISVILNRLASGISSSAEITVSGYGTFTLSVNASAPLA